jgi:hypothetical protein
MGNQVNQMVKEHQRETEEYRMRLSQAEKKHEELLQ